MASRPTLTTAGRSVEGDDFPVARDVDIQAELAAQALGERRGGIRVAVDQEDPLRRARGR